MPLHQDGKPVTSSNLDGEVASARDENGNRVAVSASHAAARDYGWPVIWRAASAKHDREGGTIVRVTTDDCAGLRVKHAQRP
jgi:hypothetical protein